MRRYSGYSKGKASKSGGKSKKKDTPLFFVYRTHDGVLRLPQKNDKNARKGVVFMSVDPGTRNCAVRFERRFFKKNKDDEEEVFKVETILQVLWDLNPPLTAAQKREMTSPEFGIADIRTYDNLNWHLKNILEFIMMCDVFVLERQLPVNYNATRACQHIITYCMQHCKPEALIIEIEPRLKTMILKHGPGSEIKDHKDWSEIKCEELLTDRGDAECLDVIRSFKKQDDVSDTVVQIEALMVHLRDKFEDFEL